ncbi:hypothetical protein N7457_006667 [Penicillium paradoxum]|uniref:uncharacterized protein n=1 Tax=Penicillium paradoxum TaxID=176176 RepID=UPI0025476F92|nr:uncharacterized protein N7457_006667 [Penicillium paradoxum]KAJ5778947.1 hypothetical protein N7457_006667 [Penicillium paradoxum]
MSSEPRTLKSIFAKPPVKIIVGSDDSVYYVHHGVLETHPAFDARLKESTDQYENVIDWSGFDEQTVECVLSFLYSGSYQTPLGSSEAVDEDDAADAGEEVLTEEEDEDGEATEVTEDDIEEAPEGTDAEPLSPVPESPPSQAISECDLNDRPLTPLDQCCGVNLATEQVSESKIIDQDQDQDEDQDADQEAKGNTAAEIYFHAKVYSFARQLDFSKLEQFSLNSLAEVLVALEKSDQGPFPYLADAIRLIYQTTTTGDDGRNLLSQFVALRYTALGGEDLDTLITEGGEFMVDLSHKLARKLTTISTALEERLGDLISRNEELEEENAEKDKELKALREGIHQWKNGAVPSFPSFTYQI